MKFQNFFAAKLYTDIGASDTAITLDTAPTATSGRMVLEARNPTQREIISFTGVSGNQLTGVVRGVGGTTAKSHLKNALIEMNLTADDIQDLYDAFNSFSANNNDWRSLATTPTSVVYNGQRSYTLTFSGVDYTNVLNPGTRLRTTRTVAAPTQCTSLNGTNQYFVKTSPNKMTFTDDFVVDAYIYLTTYSNTIVVSRYNATSGWYLNVDNAGVVKLAGFNASVSNHSQVFSTQSVPLNRWVRITAQLDMSSYSATTSTSYIMFDGVDVPASVNRGGTNPTALIQAGNLEIGSFNNGALPFPGKIAQVAIFNSKITQATIRSYHSQGYTGTEPNLISAYSFNGVATDLMTTTPNDLTAMNSAGYTNDSPFGTQGNSNISSTLDYALVSKVSFSTNTTVICQVPEGCAIPTSGGISAVSYSGVEVPYGFPSDENKWSLYVIAAYNAALNVSVLNTNYDSGFRIIMPIGKWSAVLNVPFGYAASNGSGISSPNEGHLFVAKTSDVSSRIPGMRLVGFGCVSASPVSGVISGSVTAFCETDSATSYSVWYVQPTYTGGAAFMAIRGDYSAAYLRLSNSYL